MSNLNGILPIVIQDIIEHIENPSLLKLVEITLDIENMRVTIKF